VAQDAIVMGVTRWKRSAVRAVLAGEAGAIAYRRVSRRAVAEARRRNARLYVWGAREAPWLADEAAAAGVSLSRIEDGFLRSVGLGSNFTPALSLVVDALGIYSDPTRESGLERILNDPAFPSPELREDARRLRGLLIARGLTKYNVRNIATERSPSPLEGEGGMMRDSAAFRVGGASESGESAKSAGKDAKRRILVPGQVEDDASIQRGGAPNIRTNLALLEAVRAENRQAILFYKPHPDVESGNRRGAVPEAAAKRLADRVLSGWDALAALAQADEVHTMTSLMGFEALLRGRAVTTYGLPFYAGLGLTTDRVVWPRPRRPVDLDALVAAALIAYPRYRDPARGAAIDVFAAVELLERHRDTAPPPREGFAVKAARWLALSLGR
jgi:capsular polysaccharide export protein